MTIGKNSCIFTLRRANLEAFLPSMKKTLANAEENLETEINYAVYLKICKKIAQAFERAARSSLRVGGSVGESCRGR